MRTTMYIYSIKAAELNILTSSHAPACGNVKNRLFDEVAIRAPQQLIKLRRGLKYEGHALMDVGQIGKVIAAETNCTSIVTGTALAGQGQFDGCSGTGR